MGSLWLLIFIVAWAFNIWFWYKLGFEKGRVESIKLTLTMTKITIEQEVEILRLKKKITPMKIKDFHTRLFSTNN